MEQNHDIDELIEELGDEDDEIQDAAASALVEIGAPAVPALIEALGYDIWDVCDGAAEHLLGLVPPLFPS